jgi:hypothetical protein
VPPVIRTLSIFKPRWLTITLGESYQTKVVLEEEDRVSPSFLDKLNLK